MTCGWNAHPILVSFRHMDLAAEPESPARLRIEDTWIGHRAVIAASGELDIATAGELGEVVMRAIEAGAADVWLDLSGIEFMDSSGLRALLVARRALIERRRRLAVICGPGPVSRVLRIAGLEDRIAVYPDRAAAHAAG
jgi:anti-sigma B factor antagonist